MGNELAVDSVQLKKALDARHCCWIVQYKVIGLQENR